MENWLNYEGFNNNNNKSDNSFQVPPQTYDASSSSSHLHHGHGLGLGSGSASVFWPDMVRWGLDEEDKAVSASKNHSQAEKRRRDRINGHLTTLRKLVSNSDKMDKASLLGSVVEHVKELKKKTTELSTLFTIPTDTDEVIIDVDTGSSSDHYPSDSENVLIRASVCCDDRPEIISELKHALKGLRLTTVRADMSSLGGRIKGSFLLCSEATLDGIGLNGLKQSLRAVLSRIASPPTSKESNYRLKSKRQRFFSSHNQAQKS